MSKRKKIVIGLIIIIPLFMIMIGMIGENKKKSTDKKNSKIEKKIPVVAKTVSSQTIVERLALNGEIKGQKQVDIYPDVPGKVYRIFVKEGNFVRRGQTVASIDRSIVGMHFVPAPVTSPISGVVGKIYVDRGKTVSPAVPLMMVADMRLLEGVLNVQERLIGKIKIGQKVIITVDSYPDKIFKGIISRKGSFIDPTNRTLQIKVRFLNTGGKLVPGNYANYSVQIRSMKNQLVIPFDAVLNSLSATEVYILETIKNTNKNMDLPEDISPELKNNPKSMALMWLPQNIKKMIVGEGNEIIAKRIAVDLGVRDGNFVQVLKGLKEGDRVITLGKENVVGGNLLKIVPIATDKKTTHPKND